MQMLPKPMPCCALRASPLKTTSRCRALCSVINRPFASRTLKFMAPKRKTAHDQTQPRTTRQRAAKASAKSLTAAAPAASSAAAKSSSSRGKAVKSARGSRTKAKAIASGQASAAGTGAVAAPTTAAPVAKRQVDPFCAAAQSGGLEVCKDYDITLNQTDIKGNANKFYRLQMLTTSNGSSYLVWTRWGRVGVAGQSKMLGPFSSEAEALCVFDRKFRDKAGASWSQRHSIKPRPGKYVPIEIDPEATATPAKAKKVVVNGTIIKYKPCTLDLPTQELVDLILADATFTSAMAEYDIDVDRFPLGQLTKGQVQKGLDILQALRQNISQGGSTTQLETLSSQFYSVIPHAFGFKRPPVLNSLAVVNKKVEMCNVLTDIEIAQEMLQDQKQESEAESLEIEQDHPLDEKYSVLNADLQLLGTGDSEYAVIKQYIKATQGRFTASMANVWRVSRRGEDERFAAHDSISNRRLLWHGTNCAVVAAVLKAGLRIMPHSGGRVGKGIYLASEHAKSAAYVSPGSMKGRRMGIMFLAEAALGKEHSIVYDDSSLRAPPAGYDCVIAQGRQEPNPKLDTQLLIDGKPVIVPQGKPQLRPKYKNSRFDQSEYLLYSESQSRLRYIISFDWGRGY